MSDKKPPSIPPRQSSKKQGSGRSSTPRASGSSGSSGSSTSAKGSVRSADAGSGAPSTAKPATGSTKATAPAATTVKGAPTETEAAAAAASVTTAVATAPAVEPERPAVAERPVQAERPARPAKPAKQSDAGPRRVRLAVSRIDPWSVMKLSFLVSFALGIMLIVAVTVLWLALDGMQVFAKINDLATEILADSNIDLLQYVALPRVLSVTTLVAIVDIFLITALSTIGAFLYNITAALVGGVHLTMTDD